MNYIDKIKIDMYSAMKADQKVKANILRSLLALLKKVEIETKNPLSEDQFLVVVKKMVKQLKESVEVYSKAGRGELAEKEKSELKIIQVYLPEQLSEEKTIELVKEVISEISAESISDMGKVMSMVMQKSGGKVDGGIANRIAKENFWTLVSTFSFITLLVLNFLFDLRLNRVDLNLYETFNIFLAVTIFVIFLISTLLSIYKLYLSGVLIDAARSSTKITSMVFIILIGETFFRLVFRGLGGDETIEHFLTSLPGGTFSAILIVMISMFLLGFFLDFIEITFVVVPIVAPIILQMGIDPVWLGVMMAINLQTSFLTPPFGFALFYLRGVAPDSVKTSDIYKGVIPFILIQMIMLILLSVFPGVSTWLPSYIFN